MESRFLPPCVAFCIIRHMAKFGEECVRRKRKTYKRVPTVPRTPNPRPTINIFWNAKPPTKTTLALSHDLIFRQHLVVDIVLVHRFEDHAQLLPLEIDADIRGPLFLDEGGVNEVVGRTRSCDEPPTAPIPPRRRLVATGRHRARTPGIAQQAEGRREVTAPSLTAFSPTSTSGGQREVPTSSEGAFYSLTAERAMLLDCRVLRARQIKRWYHRYTKHAK